MVTHLPRTFAELQRFYTDVYTPLYDRFINSGSAPQELHAESAADYFLSLLTDKTVVRAVAKTRRQKFIAAGLWILSVVFSALLGAMFSKLF